MTPEQIRETLYRTLDRLDNMYGERSSREEVLRKEREAHALEMSNLKEEMASKDRRIAALEKELAERY